MYVAGYLIVNEECEGGQVYHTSYHTCSFPSASSQQLSSAVVNVYQQSKWMHKGIADTTRPQIVTLLK